MQRNGFMTLTAVVGAVVLAATTLAVTALAVTTPAAAFSIELKDAAPLRIEQQRDAALGRLPLSGTPELARRADRLKALGLREGDPVFIRVFKAEAELEVWMQKGDAFVLFATYPICFWSGTLGPKIVEGDNQTPEGFYTVTRRQLHRSGRHPRSLNLGFPNAFDRANRRTGSYILVHGACSSVGCYAMTDPVVAEIFALAERALYNGQDRIHVHAFPFRMSEENLARHADSPWAEFWRSLKPAYDAFEAKRLPPTVGVCGRDYAFGRGRPDDEGDPGPLAVHKSHGRAARDERLACEDKDRQPPLVVATGSIEPPSRVGRLTGAGVSVARFMSRKSARRAEQTAAVKPPARIRRLKKAGASVTRFRSRHAARRSHRAAAVKPSSGMRRHKSAGVSVTRYRSRQSARRSDKTVAAEAATNKALFRSN